MSEWTWFFMDSHAHKDEQIHGVIVVPAVFA